MSGFIGLMSVFHPRNVGYTAQWFKNSSPIQPTLNEVSGQRPHEWINGENMRGFIFVRRHKAEPNVVSSGLIVGRQLEPPLNLPLFC